MAINELEKLVSERVRERFSEEDLAVLERILSTTSNELMPECDGIFPPKKQ